MRVDEHPDRVRHFGREPVDLKRTHEANRPARNPLHDLRYAVEFGDLRFRVQVQPSVHLVEQPLLNQAPKVHPRDPERVEVACPQRPLLGQVEDRSASRGVLSHVPK